MDRSESTAALNAKTLHVFVPCHTLIRRAELGLENCPRRAMAQGTRADLKVEFAMRYS